MIIDTCSWDSPGANPYQGSTVKAVSYYKDLSTNVSNQLKEKISARRYDDIVEITQYGLVGKQTYTDLRDMHFGKNTVCKLPSRKNWSPKMKEIGLVYCVEDNCLIIPTVCRNVSRISIIRPNYSTGPGIYYHIPDNYKRPSVINWPEPTVSGTVLPNSVFPAYYINTNYTYYSGYGWLPYKPNPPITPGIPEPETWLMYLVGVALVGILKFNSKS